MVAWSQLFLPILLSAVLVFLASSVIHMVLQLHKSDYRKLSNEDEVRAAVRKGSPSPGQYVLPHCADAKQMAEPEMVRKLSEGPCAVMFVRPAGVPSMGSILAKWFVYTAVVAALAGYVAQSTLSPGAPYLAVFRIVGTAAWLAYAWQGPSDSIWKGAPWSLTLRSLFDGLIYACLTAGTFAWLWPR